MISMFKKKVLSIFSLYDDICQPFSQQEIQKVVDMSPTELPTEYVSFLREIGRAILSEDGYDVTMNFWDTPQIEEWLRVSPQFVETMPAGIPIGDDLGDILYYYGNGNGSLGYYAVEKGSGNFYEDAYKFSNSLVEFLTSLELIGRLSNWIDTGDPDAD